MRLARSARGAIGLDQAAFGTGHPFPVSQALRQ